MVGGVSVILMLSAETWRGKDLAWAVDTRLKSACDQRKQPLIEHKLLAIYGLVREHPRRLREHEKPGGKSRVDRIEYRFPCTEPRKGVSQEESGE